MALTQVNPALFAGSSNTTAVIQSNGTTAITVDSSQNVGIGTTTPAQKLEVNGNVKISSGNLVIGTSDKLIQDSTGATLLSTRSSQRISTFFGDTGASGSSIATTILTAAASGLWAVSGRFFFKRNSDNPGEVLAFVTAYDANTSRGVTLNTTPLVGSSSQTPTIAYSGNNLQLTTPAYCYAYAIIDGIVVSSGSVTLNGTIFN